jgi:hypothetical protein
MPAAPAPEAAAKPAANPNFMPVFLAAAALVIIGVAVVLYFLLKN